MPYLDMPLQHINDTMLRRMQRRVNRAETEAAAGPAAASGFPSLVLRTTFITGFPGETDEQFDELVEFVAPSSGFSGWACLPIRSSPTRRRPGSTAICRKK